MMRTMPERRWWLVLVVALVVICLWPPERDRSLAAKFMNWAVDPRDDLPVLPPQLGFGVGDDPRAVEERDALVRRYDALYNRGGLTRLRLQLKVADDPQSPATERQLLLAAAAVALFLLTRFGSR
jgi:hypothetical protein